MFAVQWLETSEQVVCHDFLLILQARILRVVLVELAIGCALALLQISHKSHFIDKDLRCSEVAATTAFC